MFTSPSNSITFKFISQMFSQVLTSTIINRSVLLSPGLTTNQKKKKNEKKNENEKMKIFFFFYVQ